MQKVTFITLKRNKKNQVHGDGERETDLQTGFENNDF